jgi:predicted glycoside hydrolase/deacetylase ChbG (UPF0249 family)
MNADGYGFTEGITRAIDECVAFGTVRSLSANVNFPHAEALARLVAKFPFVSVGCHLNPVVGRPVLEARQVPSLVDENGEFFYKTFESRFQSGALRLDELRAEMLAQIEKTRGLAGEAFSHVDFHRGLHRLPRLYPLFLEVAEASGVGRIRTHRYRAGMESGWPRLSHAAHILSSPTRAAKYSWNLLLRRKARTRGFAMPDNRVAITHMETRPGRISVENFRRMLVHLPRGFSEFTAHPAYVDDELRRWSTYIDQRVAEREVLLSSDFRTALYNSEVTLAGYRDIPVPESTAGRSTRSEPRGTTSSAGVPSGGNTR